MKSVKLHRTVFTEDISVSGHTTSYNSPQNNNITENYAAPVGQSKMDAPMKNIHHNFEEHINIQIDGLSNE